MYFYGLPEHHIENVNIENVTVHSQVGAELMESENIRLKNVNIYSEQAPALLLRNVKNVSVEGFNTDESLETIFEIAGNRSQNINFSSFYGEDKLKTGKDTQPDIVKLNKPD